MVVGGVVVVGVVDFLLFLGLALYCLICIVFSVFGFVYVLGMGWDSIDCSLDGKIVVLLCLVRIFLILLGFYSIF